MNVPDYSNNIAYPQFSAPQPAPLPAPAVAPMDFGNGKYTILLLKRRDIAKKIVSIQNWAFDLKICNSFKVVLDNPVSQKVQIKITKTTNNSCDTK